MADMKVISKELVILATFRPGQAPDTPSPYNSVLIRPYQAVITVEAADDRPFLRHVTLTGFQVLKDGSLGEPHDITFWPGNLPTWLSVVAGEARELANG